MDLAALTLTEKDGAVRLEVHAKPRAKKSRVVGLHGAALDVSLAAPPVDGAANEELVLYLSRVLEVPKSSVSVARGAQSRNKLVEVRGLTAAELRAKLAREG